MSTPDAQPFTLAQLAGADPPKRRRWRTVIIPAAVASLVLIGGAAAAVLLWPTDKPADTDPLQQVRPVCRQAASKQLKAPSTARFSDETVTVAGERAYDLQGLVDAQNGFGAQIRNRYRCHAFHNIDGSYDTTVTFEPWN